MLNTSLCHIEHDGKYLMLHRIKKKNDLNQDKWIGIGGKFKDRESPEECNVREVFEETGLTLTRCRYRGIVTFVSDRWETEYMHIFTADEFTGEIKECNEGKLEWIDKAKIYDLPIWEGDRIFLKLIENPETPFFSLKLEYDVNDVLKTAKLNNIEIGGNI